MTITERIAAAIKPILDEDRRADRERIAELERDLAALALENKRLREDDDEPPAMVDLTEMARVLDECCVQKPGRYDNSTLRIDTDMSDPQPGKLLVVRLEGEDSYKMLVGQAPYLTRDQFVGFLVETPAVKQEEQGPWVVYDRGCSQYDLRWRTAEGWFSMLGHPRCFRSKEDAQEAIRDFGIGAKSFCVITLAEARDIEAKR